MDLLPCCELDVKIPFICGSVGRRKVKEPQERAVDSPGTSVAQDFRGKLNRVTRIGSLRVFFSIDCQPVTDVVLNPGFWVTHVTTAFKSPYV